VPELPDGFYSGRIFVFPHVPEWRRFECRLPRYMHAPLGRIFQKGVDQVFSRPRAWFRISMPVRIPWLHIAISSIWLHASSASNVECFNQTVYFGKHGASAPISREGGASKFLVAPLSVLGESATPYLQEFQPSSDPNTGRYTIQNGRIQLTPARGDHGRTDGYVNLRLWVTSGKLGNKVGPGQVESFINKAPAPFLKVVNPASAAGGTDGENFQDAHARFAHALLSRDRIITRADLIASVRAFDRRIRDAKVAFGLRRSAEGLQRVQRIAVTLSRDEFVDPEVETPVLIDELSRWLRDRFLYDIDLAVDLDWA
jgi:hypothetical protein